MSVTQDYKSLTSKELVAIELALISRMEQLELWRGLQGNSEEDIASLNERLAETRSALAKVRA